MKIESLSFGIIVINGREYREDIVIDRGEIKLRDKSKSRKYKHLYGHTPLTVEENIPWKCKTLIIAKGFYDALPVTDEIFKQAEKLNVQIKAINTKNLPAILNKSPTLETNFIIHLTC